MQCVSYATYDTTVCVKGTCHASHGQYSTMFPCDTGISSCLEISTTNFVTTRTPLDRASVPAQPRGERTRGRAAAWRKGPQPHSGAAEGPTGARRCGGRARKARSGEEIAAVPNRRLPRGYFTEVQRCGGRARSRAAARRNVRAHAAVPLLQS